MFVQAEDELLGDDWLDDYVTKLLDKKYDKNDTKGVVK